jgi:prepilin-type processing-associated H-X9-DG protein
MDSTLSFRKLRAFTFVELMVIIAVIGMIAVLLLPAFSHAKARSKRIDCVNNLKEIGTSLRVWSDESNSAYPSDVSTNLGGSKEYLTSGDVMPYFRCISNNLSSPKILVCPVDTRKPADNFAMLKNANISYFVGLDASESMPQMLLMGDRNVAINNQPVKPGLVTIKSNDIVSWTAEMHNGFGNVGMADGSVHQCTDYGLQSDVTHMETNKCRLAVP